MAEEGFINIRVPYSKIAEGVQGIELSKLQTEPKESDITTPRWTHWYQRKLARPWMATLLSMDIEPTQAARRALKAFEPDRYAEFQDRLDIAKTLIGHELQYFEDHLREGETAGEKYVFLVDFYAFAEKLKWEGLDAMKIGLHIESSPPNIEEIPVKKLNGIYVLLHELLRASVSGFDVKQNASSAKKIDAWLSDGDSRRPVQTPTLSKWIKEMQDAVETFDGRQTES